MSDDEVAVALNSKSVQFVSVRKSLTVGQSFKVNFQPEGIAHNARKLYLTGSRPARVVAYSNTGLLLKTIELDASCQLLLSWPHHLIISEDPTALMVAHEGKGIVMSDLKGYRMSCFSDPELKQPYGICNGMNGTMFVAGKKSNNIVQFNSKGDKLGVILQEKDGIHDPYSVCWDRVNSRLLVAMPDTDCIKVYNIM